MTPRVLADGAPLVTVRATPARPVVGLELYGELPCWEQPIAMQRAGAGFEAQLRLGPGVYEIKARAPDGSWLVDPSWRTIARGDEVNGVVVVGGTDEPVLHAPASPWLRVAGDGRVTVRAALRRGAGDRLALRVDEGLHWMQPIGDTASHRWFELELAGATRALEYAFVLADGRTIGAAGCAITVALRDVAHALPAWWHDAVVYTIFVDRFRRAGGWRGQPGWQRDDRAGGDLDGIRDALPYLADLGVTALHLTPICLAPSVHRYDAIDPVAIEPALGGEPAFARLVDAAHARGMRVIVDVATTHVDRELAPFRDVRERGPGSPYWPWFQTLRWPFFDGPDPGYRHYQKGQWQEPLLAVDHPEVQDAICGWFQTWARRGIDGVRVDAAADLPPALLARIRDTVRAVNRDAIVIGEVVPACVQRFAPGALDAATDFAAREALVGWLAGGAAATVVETYATQRLRGAAGPHALGFTSTHDQPRIATVTQDPAIARLGLVAVVLGARVPLLYYGDEIGLGADRDAAARAFEDAWPDRQPMPWDATAWDRETLAAVTSALALRRAARVVRHGDERVEMIAEDTIVIRRALLDDVIEIVIHRGTSERAIAVDGEPVLALAVGDARLAGDQLVLGPRSLAVLDRRAPISVELCEHNSELADHAARYHMTDSVAYPTRLYVTVTEACNLRCQHCITDAPARTQSGRARTLQPWLLDALEPAFAHADYVAFTHGGESITAPIFPEVLRRIARARARRSRRADIHLVSNGMLLDEARVAELAELGVTSLMISLDGATPTTNDRIRVLGKLDRVVANVAAAVQLRAREQLDLRIGISTVVGRLNHHELPALGKLCLELGVDWLKVEETYPATAFARHDLLSPRAPEVTAAMAALRDVVAGRPLVLVDHLDPPAGCGCVDCTDDPVARAFRDADDFANRFAYRACRAAYEQVAIDPDGTVHLVDYAGAPLGSLLEQPMLALWNAPPAVQARCAECRPR
ncbi:MAG TPA: alpha-amylase family glycosyl hydrolase [Kofleriaceae bacterium]|nr:alpha-amylase family glycosyl hydrolase [Kofleriaceae bacterium]